MTKPGSKQIHQSVTGATCVAATISEAQLPAIQQSSVSSSESTGECTVVFHAPVAEEVRDRKNMIRQEGEAEQTCALVIHVEINLPDVNHFFALLLRLRPSNNHKIITRAAVT